MHRREGKGERKGGREKWGVQPPELVEHKQRQMGTAAMPLGRVRGRERGQELSRSQAWPPLWPVAPEG